MHPLGLEKPSQGETAQNTRDADFCQEGCSAKDAQGVKCVVGTCVEREIFKGGGSGVHPQFAVDLGYRIFIKALWKQLCFERILPGVTQQKLKGSKKKHECGLPHLCTLFHHCLQVGEQNISALISFKLCLTGCGGLQQSIVVSRCRNVLLHGRCGTTQRYSDGAQSMCSKMKLLD